jgi:RNA polymerase sigma factor FliA
MTIHLHRGIAPSKDAPNTPHERPAENVNAGHTLSMTIGSCKTQRGPPRPLSDLSRQAAKQVRRDALVLENIPLVKAIAARLHGGLPVYVDRDDLVQAGVLGLIDAANKFDAEKHVTFSNYAKHRIKGAMLDSLRKLDWASRDMRRRQKDVEATTGALAAILLRTPTESEVAEKMGINIERWRSIMLDLRNLGPVSASTRANEDDNLPAPDFPCAPETQPDSICAHQQLRRMLSEATKTLPVRHQKIVMLYHIDEMTMKEIGGLLGINESRVSQIHKVALEKMANVLHKNGIDSIHAF